MSDDEMEKILGFTSFGSNKETKKFDIMEIFHETHSIAKQRNEVANRLAAFSTDNNSDDDPDVQTLLRKPEVESEDINDTSDIEEFESNEFGNSDPEGPFFIPLTDNLLLKHGSKPLTAVAIDPAGSRVATGGFDFEVKLWDFSGMDKTCRAFRNIQPCEDHQIKNLEFSPSGENLLVVSGQAQARIIDRDGEIICETIRGYQYITDPSSAKGHTHALNGGIWHPIDAKKFLTWSQDATVRTWDLTDTETVLNDTKLPKYLTIIKPRNGQGRKVIPTSCAYSKDGMYIAAGCQDGSLQIWDTRRPLVNTTELCRTAHPVGTVITSLAWSWDCRQIASRANDDTLRLWDLRNIAQGATHTLRDLPVLFDQTEVCFSPNDTMVATGVSANRNDPNSGGLAIYRRDNFELLSKNEPGQGSVIRVTWSPRIRQIISSYSSGCATVHFDPSHSRNGALMCAYRQATEASRRRRQGHSTAEAFVKPVLLTFDEDSVRAARKMRKRFGNLEDEQQLALAAVITSNERDQIAATEAANKASRKRTPAAGEDVGQRVGSLHRYMVQQIVLKKNAEDDRAEKDIRGAILRHAEAAKTKPFWTKAYLKTQPNPIFMDPSAEESASNSKKAKLS